MITLQRIAERLAKVLHNEGYFHGPYDSGYRTEDEIHREAAAALAADLGLRALVSLETRHHRLNSYLGSEMCDLEYIDADDYRAALLAACEDCSK